MFTLDQIMSKPPFVNEIGVKFWLHAELTNCAKRRGLSTQVVLTKHPDNVLSYVIIDKNEYVFENQSYEAICCHLDIMKFVKDDKASGIPEQTGDDLITS